jgi:hypothetical protein
MGAINFNDGPPYDRLDIASAAATATSDGRRNRVDRLRVRATGRDRPVHDPARPGHRQRARGGARTRGGDGVAPARRQGMMLLVPTSHPAPGDP